MMSNSIWPESNGGNKPLPVPNVVVARAGTTSDQLSPEAVKGILVNPIYTGVRPYPRLVEDGTWVRACAKLIKERRGGPIPGQPALRPTNELSAGIDGMKVNTTFLQMFTYTQWVVPPPREGLAVAQSKRPTVAHNRLP